MVQCSNLVVQSQFSSKFPALALKQTQHIIASTSCFTRPFKISLYNSVKVYIKCKGGKLRGGYVHPKLLTLVHWSLITTYHKEHRLRMLLGVVRDISPEETCG